MGGYSFPALDIKPPESPIQQLGGVIQLKSAMQSQQIGEIQLQEARRAQQSQQTLMSLYAKNGGDLNQTYQDAVASGQVTPEHLMQFRTQGIAAQTQMATLDEKKLANLQKTHDMAADALEAVKSLPVEQRPDEIKRQFGVLVSQGVDPKQLIPALNGLPDYSDASINRLETTFKGEQWLVQNELKQRELASAPTPAQAQAQTKATLDKTINESNQAAAKASLDLEQKRQLGQVTPKDIYNQQQENYRATLSRQATFENTMRKDGLDKLTEMFANPQHGYVQFIAQAQSVKDTVMQSRNGSELASNLVPLMTALGVTSFAGVHRINQTEVNQAGSGVGSLYRKVNSILDKVGSGSVPADTLKETNALIDGLIDAKHSAVMNGANMIIANSHLDPEKTMVMDRSGVMTSFDKASAGNPRVTNTAPNVPQTGTVTMRAPNGQTKQVAASEVDHYKSMGATVVNP